MCFGNLKGSVFLMRGGLICSPEYRPRHCVIMWKKGLQSQFLGFKIFLRHSCRTNENL